VQAVVMDGWWAGWRSRAASMASAPVYTTDYALLQEASSGAPGSYPHRRHCQAGPAARRRLAEGITLRNNEVNDDEKGFVASGELNPAKSRVLLQLSLTKTSDPVRIQQMFYEY
jgi:hypothetical protein